MTKLFSIVLLSVIASSYLCDAYKILVLFPFPSKSHANLGYGIVHHLLNAGHEIIHVTPYPKHKTSAQYHEIDLSSNANLMQKVGLNITHFMLRDTEWAKNFIFFTGLLIATKTVEHENFQKLLADKSQKFDLVIAEWMLTEVYAGVATIYDAPFIWFLAIEPHWMVTSLVDEYLNPAYNVYDGHQMPPLTFMQRVKELWFTIKQTLIRETIILYRSCQLHNQYIVPHIESRSKIVPSFHDLRYNASLVFGNSHVSMGLATRLPENYKSIGGFHIDDNVPPLPEDLKKIIEVEGAKHGVIYFSMGSNLKSKEMPLEMITGLKKVFAGLKQIVIWKFEGDLPDKPKNVHILQWAPQQSILAHPNVILFITHGGHLSTTEAIYHGKPIVCIPVFADQFTNAARAVSRGFGKKVDLSYSLADDLKVALDDILNDPKYAARAKELSFIHHHRPVKPGVEIVHWSEHVIQTKGAPHMRSAALMVPWYQKMYLDLAAVLILAAIVIRRIFRKIKNVIFSKKTDKKKTN